MRRIRLSRLVAAPFAWMAQRRWLWWIHTFLRSSLPVRALATMRSTMPKGLRFERSEAWHLIVENVSENSKSYRSQSSVGPGVNVLGYLRGEFGLAESARMYARALIEGGYKVALNNIDLDLPHSWNDRSLDPWISESSPYPNSIVFINPDFFELALKKIGSERSVGHRLIACWFWELETIPEQWHAVIEQVDEIMVASTFVEEAFRRSTDKPILRVPLPVCPMSTSSLERKDFGLEAGKFTFLCMFDFHSSIERKNPFAVIEAFRTAFPPHRTDVSLLIKTSNGQSAVHQLKRLLKAASADSRILVRDDVIPKAHVQALLRCCDAYVSLHRAEGFGLGMAEAMALGKPVIATGWSGNMDFMDAENSIPVQYRLIPIPPGDYPFSEGARWADADVEAAAAAMAKVVEEPGFANRLGKSAAESIRENLSPSRVAEEIHHWLSRPRASGIGIQ
ncbi:glycosyltransferase [Pseudoxanthomonas sp. UTMC 1351]|uniref:glycosyltransferase n=1 Tax=Pseudoxanthomonas sp. UTMC 1351 TaxID=2695853 RepID=UPI0034CD1BF6